MDGRQRLQKVLSQQGVASRRQAEELIRDRRVTVNGVIATIGQTVDPIIDVLAIDGRSIAADRQQNSIYLLLNKPVDVISACSDDRHRRVVLDLLPPELRFETGIHPVGRLDRDSTGALLLTNDGELTYILTHPRHEIEKTYEVLVTGIPSRGTLNRWRAGIILDDRRTLSARVEILQVQSRNAWLQIVLREGRNRQIRRCATILGHPVLKLHRRAIGPVDLRDNSHPQLSLGRYRFLSDREISYLKDLQHPSNDTKK
jgi:pseudouridine synthase